MALHIHTGERETVSSLAALSLRIQPDKVPSGNATMVGNSLLKVFLSLKTHPATDVLNQIPKTYYFIEHQVSILTL